MLNARQRIAAIALLAGLTLLVPAQRAFAQGACCTIDNSCTNVTSAAECTALQGIVLDGANCADSPCNPGACCQGQSCGVTGAYNCVAAGRQFAGAGTSCLDDPCNSNVGACCNNGACSDVSPTACAGSGGTWLGAGTNCGQGHCTLGACCEPGLCNDTAEFACGGVFQPSITCASTGACAVNNDCDANSLYAQSGRVNAASSFDILLSDAVPNILRSDFFSGVAGEVTEVTWWGIELDTSGPDAQLCFDSSTDFQVRFHSNNPNNTPGPAVCDYTVTATRTLTGAFVDDGIQVNEYHATLPTPCFLVEGWLEIYGLGDFNCQFYWINGYDGDGDSYCQGCGPGDLTPDLPFCLGGDLGGVFGACCDENDGSCSDNVEVQDCIGTGLRFERDMACADIDCQQVEGACCFPDGSQSCQILTELGCEQQGGDWLGAFSTCFDCPEIGACCIQDDDCSITTRDVCEAEGHTFIGDGTTCAECPPIPPECPAEDTLAGYQSSGPANFDATTSEVSTDFKVSTYYSGVGGAIDALTWYGFQLEFIGGTFVGCAEPGPFFDIVFYEDAGGRPGPEVCRYDDQFVITSDTIINYRRQDVLKFEIDLPTPCVLPYGWVSIQGRGSSICWHLWLSGESPAGYCEGCGTEFIDGRNICLRGDEGGIYGACCDDETASCSDDTEISSCAQPPARFLADGTCGSLTPACGVIEGACCFGDGTCSILEEDTCLGSGGDWLGDRTICDACPCIVNCPEKSDQEGEVECSEGYIDTYNGGCDGAEQRFQPLARQSTMCGATGVFNDSFGILVPDYDAFEISVPLATTLTIDATGEFEVAALLYDLSGGCPGEILDAAGAFECDNAHVELVVDAGTYYLVVRPVAATDNAACSAPYVLSIDDTLPRLGDSNGDFIIDAQDHAAFVDCMAGPDNPPNPQLPFTTSLDCLLWFDYFGDGDVDMADQVRFARQIE